MDAIEPKHLEAVVREVTRTDVRSQSRHRPNVEARAIYFHLCKQFTSLSLYEIGKTMGKDHATVIHGVKRCLEWSELYKDYKVKVQSCESIVRNMYNMIDVERLTPEDALARIDTMQKENEKLREINVDLITQLETLKALIKKREDYLVEIGCIERADKLLNEF